MDLTFILSAAIFTLLAIVVATSLLNGSSSATDSAKARRHPGPTGGLDPPGPKQNGHVPDNKREKREEKEDDWCEVSGSSHDHWDVVKSVLSRATTTGQAEVKLAPGGAKHHETITWVFTPVTPASSVAQIGTLERRGIQEKAHPHHHTEARATPVEPPSSSSSSSMSMSLEVDSSTKAPSGRGRRSYIGLSEKELLKFAFSHPQTEGAAESPGINDKVEASENDALKYIPGKARSHHLQMMLSAEELEEEQRVQREQLAAIFELLQNNKETFGEVSEGDMEEQLKLYSI